jgi:hypothetical protein
MREGWFWALERAQNIEGDSIAPENPARAQEIAEGDNLSGRKSVEDGQNVPFAPSRISWTFGEGDRAACVRYEERSPSVSSTLEMERDGVAPRTPTNARQRFAADPEALKVAAEVLELFGGSVGEIRAWDTELESWWTWHRSARDKRERRAGRG